MKNFPLFSRLLTLIFCLFLLCQCGFEPIYQKKEVAESSQNASLKIFGGNQDAYTVYRLRQEIEPQLTSLAPIVKKKYRIHVNVQEEFGNIGYANDGTAVRAQGRISAHISVFDQTLTPIYESHVDSVSSYTINYGDEFSNLNSQDGVRERLVVDLGREIIQSLSGFFKSQS